MRIRSALVLSLLAICLPRLIAQEIRPTKGWPTATPAEVGLDAKALAAFDAEIAAGKFGPVDSMLIIRHGKLAYDRSYKHDYDRIYGDWAKKPGPLNANNPGGPYNYFNPWWHPYYRRGELHTLQSVTKTITSVTIGVASTRKEFPSLDTPMLSFFDTNKVKNVDEHKRRITLRHLLTMTGGFDWNEGVPYDDPTNACCQMEAGFDWVQFAIDRPMAHEPGAKFNYNSGGSQILSYIFRKATGADIEEYAAKHLFGPLGIEQYYWKRTPTGLADTEGGLYLRAHDLAKIWYLFLKNGVWDGRQLVDADWVKASVTPAIDVGGSGVKYGLKWWLFPYGQDSKTMAWAGSGFGGQMPMVLPEQDIVAVFTGWRVFPKGPGLGQRVALERVLQAVVPGAEEKSKP